MTNISVSWKAVFAQLNFCDFNKKKSQKLKCTKKGSLEIKRRIKLLLKNST